MPKHANQKPQRKKTAVQRRMLGRLERQEVTKFWRYISSVMPAKTNCREAAAGEIKHYIDASGNKVKYTDGIPRTRVVMISKSNNKPAHQGSRERMKRIMTSPMVRGTMDVAKLRTSPDFFNRIFGGGKE